MLGVVKEVPVAKAVPPVEAENQDTVPALGVAASVTVPTPHREPLVTVIVGVTQVVVTLPPIK